MESPLPAARLMTPTADDRGGVMCVSPPKGGFFVAGVHWPRSRRWMCRVCDSLRFVSNEHKATPDPTSRRAKLPHRDLSRDVAYSKGRCPRSFAN